MACASLLNVIRTVRCRNKSGEKTRLAEKKSVNVIYPTRRRNERHEKRKHSVVVNNLIIARPSERISRLKFPGEFFRSFA